MLLVGWAQDANLADIDTDASHAWEEGVSVRIDEVWLCVSYARDAEQPLLENGIVVPKASAGACGPFGGRRRSPSQCTE